MGGPCWARRDEHAWSIPNGEHTDDDARTTSRHAGSPMSWAPLLVGPKFERGADRQSGRSVTALARAADFDPKTCVSNTFEVQWPPKSVRMRSLPGVDRAQWLFVPLRDSIGQ